MPTIADKIKASRQSQFVGRSEELELFQQILTGEEKEVLLLYVCAPAGVGKTTLLREFEIQSIAANPIWLDGKEIVPTTEGFLFALKETRLKTVERTVLFIDEFDALHPLDGWFREVFLPELPDDSLVVLAGRQPLSNRWTGDPAWQTLSRSIYLRNLNDDEQRSYLSSRGVPVEQQKQVIEFTRGHPLALSLVAENLAQNSEVVFEPEAFPDVIRSLLERFVDNVPSPLHRHALEISSLIRNTTESILAQTVDATSAFELFDWLRHLSFVDIGSEGICPKDLVREAISIDLRWRNPDLHAQLHERARRYYSDRLGRTRGTAHQAVVSDYIYLHRDNPVVKPFFDWGFGIDAYIDKYKIEDKPELAEMTLRHEGSESVTVLEHWLERQPENVVVLRGTGESPQIKGFLLKLSLDSLTQADLSLDPGALAAYSHLNERAPLRKGENATLFRFWMDRDAYQNVSTSQSLIFVAIVQHSLTQPNLALTFVPCADPEFWSPMFSYGALVRLDHADFPIDGKSFAMFGHDWRVLTPQNWLDLLSEREVSLTAPIVESPRMPDVVLLSKEDFGMAVQDALRQFNNSPKLTANPLLRSKVITGSLRAGAPPADRIATLRDTIRNVADAWKISGRDAKLYDALEYGYISPSATQDKAAELLDVSIATFRRHLQSAISRLTEDLWQREIHS